MQQSSPFDARTRSSSLRHFSPLDSLDEDNLASLERRAERRQVAFGTVLHREGDENLETLYLLEGQVEVARASAMPSRVRAGTEDARYPISTGRRHKSTVTVTSATAEVLVISTDVLDLLVTWDQTGSYRVTDLSTQGGGVHEDDWMIQALKSPLLRRLPPVNLQALFMQMEKLDLRAGEIVVRQGAPADFYYLLVKGRCAVMREVTTGGEPLILAEVSPGSGFGEDGLLSGAPRNATVRMLTDGMVVRIRGPEFVRLCGGPIVQEVGFEEASRLVAKGGHWLDVRLPSEVAALGLRGAIRLPLYLLRRRLESLPRAGTLVVCCDTGRRSAAAAFVLSSHGFDAVVLKEGLSAALDAGAPELVVGGADPGVVSDDLPCDAAGTRGAPRPSRA